MDDYHLADTIDAIFKIVEIAHCHHMQLYTEIM